MLYLLFQLDGDRYALNVAQIAEVLPLAATKSIPGTPAWVAGVIERHGAPLLGLVLEHATHTRRIDDASFAGSGVATPDARWLGPVASLDDGLVQRVDTEAMLDAHVRALLFPAAVG